MANKVSCPSDTTSCSSSSSNRTRPQCSWRSTNKQHVLASLRAPSRQKPPGVTYLILSTASGTPHSQNSISSNRQIIIPVNMQHRDVEVSGKVQRLKGVCLIQHPVLLQRLVHVELPELAWPAACSPCIMQNRVSLSSNCACALELPRQGSACIYTQGVTPWMTGSS